MRKIYWLLLLLATLICGCTENDSYKDNDLVSDDKGLSSKKNKFSVKNKLGVLQGNDYTNKYFGFSISKPSEWVALDNEARARIMNIGAKMAFDDDENLQAALKLAKLRNFSLFSFSKYAFATSGKTNSNIMGIAENISFTNQIKTADDYFSNMRAVLKRSRLKHRIGKSVGRRVFGGVSFETMKVHAEIKKTKIEQDYYAVLKKGYALVIVVTYTNDESKKITENILASLKFN